MERGLTNILVEGTGAAETRTLLVLGGIRF
jgi:hypothetical protein